MGPPERIDPTTHNTMSGRSTTDLRLAPCVFEGKDRNVLLVKHSVYIYM